ncbi:MAG: bifunctional adenosylcobinamide kinase/adenosylcobinamide-phosphate guanylyltransferase [Cyanobium sp.]|jgi:adenosylcobinamide kinase/adenosylcobinamide-phosphate guanylyltransferase
MVAVDSLPRLTLISGPAGSGKSRWAEHLAQVSGLAVHYLATGPQAAGDPSWQRRLERHRRRRPASWHCLEVGGALQEGLEALPPADLALVDSLGTWVAAHLDRSPESWEQLGSALLEQLRRPGGPVLMVVEECGWGVVPATAIGGLFRDRLATLQRRLGDGCAASWLVLQGRALDLHQLGLAVPPER